MPVLSCGWTLVYLKAKIYMCVCVCVCVCPNHVCRQIEWVCRWRHLTQRREASENESKYYIITWLCMRMWMRTVHTLQGGCMNFCSFGYACEWGVDSSFSKYGSCSEKKKNRWIEGRPNPSIPLSIRDASETSITLNPNPNTIDARCLRNTHNNN